MSALRRLGACTAALILGVATWSANAAVTCTVSVTSISLPYDPTASGDTVATGSYTISCIRLAGDPNSLAWSLGVDDGIHATGQQNRVALAGAFYSYELYRLTPYTNPNRWRDQNNGVRFTGTLNFGASLAASQSGSFDLRLAGPQTVQPAGTYTDTVTATLRNSSTSVILNTNAFNIAVITSPVCLLATPPGNVSFTYTSFQAAAAAASTTYALRCTTALPYTMALDATSGTLLGLNYTLALSQTSGTGTGLTQSYSINGSIAGGQSGTCSTGSCSGSQTRTLTITY